jgi:hypothetical protein
MPEPDPEHIAAISAGVERAITRLFSSPDLADAIRQGVRDGIWHLGIAANTPASEGNERHSGHAD